MLNRTVMWLTWRQLFANRRLYITGALSLAPAAVALAFRLLVDVSDPEVARAFHSGVQRDIVIGVLLPLTALVFGTTAFGGEIDDSTLIYLFVKPVPRWKIVLSKYIVALSCTATMMIPTVFLPWMVLGSGGVPFAAPLAYFSGVMLGAVLYSALFVWLGLVTRKGLVIGLLYVIGFEGVLSRSVPGLLALSIRQFSVTWAQSAAASELQLGTPALSLDNVRNVGLLILVGAIGLTVRALKRYQMAERV